MKLQNPRIVATIEARMTSKRLPGKVLLPVLGKPILYYLVERLKAVDLIHNIVLATTHNPQDDILEKFALDNDIDCFRGSEDDVMARVLSAGEKAEADILVEITGDCPLIDIQITDQVIETYLNHEVDYVSNCHIRSYPDGMDVQVFSLKNLKISASMTQCPLDREHVTLHMRNNPHIFSRISLIAPKRIRKPKLGLTLDEIEDYRVINNIFEALYPNNKYFSCEDIMDFLDLHPQIPLINKDVQRKGAS